LLNNVVINGTLVVRYDLTIEGQGNSITAQKNFPAVIVGGNLAMVNDAHLTVRGLANIKGNIYHSGSNGASLSVLGALFIKYYGIDWFESSSDIIVVTAAPDKAAIEIWPTAGNALRWSPAAGGFFKSIQRQQ